jgi:tetratricopeptide (TPR) repeat protein
MTLARVAFVLVVTCAPLAWTPRADAQTKSESDRRAHDLFVKGDAAYAEARYEDALAAFREAYELSGRPQLLFNIANALERLGKLPEAVDALEKYVASGKVKDEKVVQARLANLRKRLEEQKKEDEKKQREEEERKRREAERNKVPPPPPPPPPEDKPEILPWALIGGGGVLFVTGVVFGVLTLGARSDAKAGCTDSASGHLCQDAAKSDLDREKTFGIVADVGVIAGLVAGGVGAYLLFAKPKVQVGARGISVVGTF